MQGGDEELVRGQELAPEEVLHGGGALTAAPKPPSGRGQARAGPLQGWEAGWSARRVQAGVLCLSGVGRPANAVQTSNCCQICHSSAKGLGALAETPCRGPGGRAWASSCTRSARWRTRRGRCITSGQPAVPQRALGRAKHPGRRGGGGGGLGAGGGGKSKPLLLRNTTMYGYFMRAWLY